MSKDIGTSSDSSEYITPCILCYAAPYDLFGGAIKKGHPYFTSQDMDCVMIPYDETTGNPDRSLDDFAVPIEWANTWELIL